MYLLFQSFCFFLLVLLHCVRSHVPLEEFFPYGLHVRDSQLPREDDGYHGPLSLLSTPFPFFNESYSKLFVNINGAISFRKGIKEYRPRCGPLGRESTMIAPYWADIDLYPEFYGSIFYRQSFNESDLEKAEIEVKKAFPNIWSLKFKWVYIVTYHNVSMYKPCPPNDPKNTFQAILATDGYRSFAIFFYNKLTWTTGRSNAAKGDCLGLGGIQAKAGFDTGDGKTFHEIPYSCSHNILKLVNESNVNQPGRWIFKIDNYFDSASSCNDQKYEIEKLSITPMFVRVLGGDIIQIQGPCLVQQTLENVTCKFYQSQEHVKNVTPISIDFANSKIYCQVPILDKTGRIAFQLEVSKKSSNSSNNQTPTIYKGYIYSKRFKPEIAFNITETVLNEGSASLHFNVTWNPVAFPISVKNVSLLADLINELGEQIEEIILQKNISNSGHFSSLWNISTESFLNESPSDVHLKLIPSDFLASQSVKISRLTKGSSKSWWTRNVLESDFLHKTWSHSPLGQGVRYLGSRLACTQNIWETLTLSSGEKAQARCHDFQTSDPGLPLNTKGMEPCPPTKALAQADSLRFEQDQSRWAVDHDYFHPGHSHSYRQRVPSETGARNQCVYDKEGNIMCEGPGRSTVDAGSSYKDHRNKDVLPYCDCCKYSDNCDVYFDKRPCDDGRNYKRPKGARTVGDPHFTTFDSAKYMFNGAGEFWMVKSDHFSVQTRMEPLASSRASVCTAFVFYDGSSTVQVERGSSESMEVLLNGEIIPFPTPQQLHQLNQEEEEVLEETVSIIKQKNNNILLTFQSGFTFQISRGGPSSNIISTASSNLAQEGVLGLLGKYDDLPENDLTSRNGTILPLNSTSKSIHYEFGMTWLVYQNETLFKYPEGKNYSSYYNPEFKPYFEVSPIQQSSLPVDVIRICGNSSECLFDFVSSGNIQLANETRLASEEYEVLEQVFESHSEILQHEEATTTEELSDVTTETPELIYFPVTLTIDVRNLPKTDIRRLKTKNLRGKFELPDPYLEIFLKGVGKIKVFQVFLDQNNLNYTLTRSLPLFRFLPIQHKQTVKVDIWDEDGALDEMICSFSFNLEELFEETESVNVSKIFQIQVTTEHNCTNGTEIFIRGLITDEPIDPFFPEIVEHILNNVFLQDTDLPVVDCRENSKEIEDHTTSEVSTFPTPTPEQIRTTITSTAFVSSTTTDAYETSSRITTPQQSTPCTTECSNKTTYSIDGLIPIQFEVQVTNLPQNDFSFNPAELWPDPYLKVFMKGFQPLYLLQDGQVALGALVDTWVFIGRTDIFNDVSNAYWKFEKVYPFYYNLPRPQQVLRIEIWDKDITDDDLMFKVEVDMKTLIGYNKTGGHGDVGVALGSSKKTYLGSGNTVVVITANALAESFSNNFEKGFP